ncbi:MAG: GntR family transcriptional regulator [Chloroflexota bacterium]
MGRTSRAELLYVHLREQIVAGEFSPGTPLDEVELARSMGTSRTPAREALRRLEAEGLVDKFPHRGTFVARLTPLEVDQINEVRALLEGHAARQAAVRIDSQVIERLGSELQALQLDGPTPNAVQKAMAFDIGLHRAICDASGNPQLAAVANLLLARVHGMRFVPSQPRFARVVEEHRQLLEALRARDPDAAERAMLVHLGAVTSNVGRLLRSSPTPVPPGGKAL